MITDRIKVIWGMGGVANSRSKPKHEASGSRSKFRSKPGSRSAHWSTLPYKRLEVLEVCTQYLIRPSLLSLTSIFTHLHYRPPCAMTMKRLFVLAAISLLGLLAVAHAQTDCGAGFFGDANGCCPTLIDGLAYFPDSQGCYPLSLESGVFYADENGCYPNENVRSPDIFTCLSSCG